MNIVKNYVTLLCLTVLLSSCAEIKIKDSEFCGDKGRLGATCFKTLSGSTREIPLADWDVERFGMMCSSASTFSGWKSAIQKLCEYSGRCTYKTEERVKKFGRKIRKFKKEIKEIEDFE